MKKILVLFFTALVLVGCTTPDEPANPTLPPSSTPTSTPVETFTIDEEAVVIIPSNDMGRHYWNEYHPCPTRINLFIGENGDEIGFLYDYDLDSLGDRSISEEDKIYDCPTDESGDRYLYYGKLTKLAENVYSCSGDFIPSWDPYENYVKEGVDFYIVVIDDFYYFIHEDFTIEELVNYQPDIYSRYATYEYINDNHF